MSRHLQVLAGALLIEVLAAAPATAAGTGTVVGHVQRPTAIRAYAGIQVFSAFDGSAYRLTIRRRGVLETLPVAASPEPFDVDIGPDRNGGPALVYTRCTAAHDQLGRAANGPCDLVTLSLAGGGERRLRGASTPANEYAPTLWRGQVAFARSAKRREAPVVYVAQAGAPRSRAARRLPGLPRRERGSIATDGHVIELELQGDRLAQILDMNAGGLLAEVRLVGVARRSSRVLLRAGLGEGGQYFAGVGFAGGYLHWVFDWVAGGGNLTPGAFRYRLESGRLSRADFPSAVGGQVVGFAPFSADRAYLTDAQLASDGCGEEPASPTTFRPCQLIDSGPLVFRRARGA